MPTYPDIASRFNGTGLTVRGGFLPDDDDSPFIPDGISTIIMVGNLGQAIWQPYAEARAKTGTTLDDWTRVTIEPIAIELQSRVVFPFDKPHPPFQRWAKKAERLAPSPIGILIHPTAGLWHAYRAALLFDTEIDVPSPEIARPPCDTCADKPCLTACPVDAFSAGGYDVPACSSHLATEPACMEIGCLARDACPVGRDHRYLPEQIEFHMAAFRKSVVG